MQDVEGEGLVKAEPFRFRETGTNLANFIYRTNSGLDRLKLRYLCMLPRSLPEIVLRVSKS